MTDVTDTILSEKKNILNKEQWLTAQKFIVPTFFTQKLCSIVVFINILQHGSISDTVKNMCTSVFVCVCVNECLIQLSIFL